MISPARQAAVAALIDIASGRHDLPHAVARMRAGVGERRDAALAADIVAGTIRWLARIDALIAGASERPLTNLPAAVRAVLRASVFQIDHLDRVPAHAVVHDAVELVRSLKQPALAGFANAVLRRIADPRRRPALPPLADATAPHAAQVAYLATTESHPAWLVERWMGRWGFDETLAAVRFNNGRPPLTVRVDRGRLSRDAFIATAVASGIAAEACAFAPDGVILAANAHLDDVLALAGCYAIQDEGSQLVAQFVGVEAGQRILDTCASPGGKSLAMAAQAGSAGCVVAGDYRPARVALLAKTIATAGARVHVVRHDVGRALPFADVFDRVLVDAPCSGLGTVRRDPDIKWARLEADLAGFAARQRQLLAKAAEAVAPGGRLVYATCSPEPDENEEVVDAFLADHPHFGRGSGVGAGASPFGNLLTQRGELRTLPGRHGLEAFFAAALTRNR